MLNTVASRYAQALFQVGEENNCFDSLNMELQLILDTLKQNDELGKALQSPLITKLEKNDLVTSIFSNYICNEMLNFFKILIDNERVCAIDIIAKQFNYLVNEKNNVLEGTVISAIQLKDHELKELEAQLSKKYNKTVILLNKVDHTVLGGLLVRIGNEELDGTIKNHLAKMKENLSQAIS